MSRRQHLTPDKGKKRKREGPVVGLRPQHAVSKFACLVQSSAISCRSSICPGRLSTAWLISLVVFSKVVTCEVHLSSLRRLICPAHDHLIFLCACLVSVHGCIKCHSWQHTGVVHLSLQADGKVAFEDIQVFGICCPACHDSSLQVYLCPGS